MYWNVLARTLLHLLPMAGDCSSTRTTRSFDPGRRNRMEGGTNSALLGLVATLSRMTSLAEEPPQSRFCLVGAASL